MEDVQQVMATVEAHNSMPEHRESPPLTIIRFLSYEEYSEWGIHHYLDVGMTVGWDQCRAGETDRFLRSKLEPDNQVYLFGGRPPYYPCGMTYDNVERLWTDPDCDWWAGNSSEALQDLLEVCAAHVYE